MNKEKKSLRQTWGQFSMSFKLIGATLLFVALTTLANSLYLISSEKRVLVEQMNPQFSQLNHYSSVTTRY